MQRVKGKRPLRIEIPALSRDFETQKLETQISKTFSLVKKNKLSQINYIFIRKDIITMKAVMMLVLSRYQTQLADFLRLIQLGFVLVSKNYPQQLRDSLI